MTTLSIIGLGAVGKSFAQRAARSDAIRLDKLVDKSVRASTDAAVHIGDSAAAALEFDIDFRASDFVLIAVQDKVLADCVARLEWAQFKPSTIVFHTSGYHDLAVLDPLKQHRLLTAALHPLASFMRGSPNLEDGVWCTLDCERRATQRMRNLSEALGFGTVVISAVNRPLYHAAIVMMANYIATLVEAGLSSYEDAGVDRSTARTIVRPILMRVLETALSVDPKDALSGPIVRGDFDVLKGHYHALAPRPQLQALYVQLASLTAALADNKRELPPSERKALSDLLEGWSLDHSGEVST